MQRIEVREIAEYFGRWGGKTLVEANTVLVFPGRYKRERRQQDLFSLFRGPGINGEFTFYPLSNVRMPLEEE